MTIVVSGETYHVTAGQTDTGDIVLNGGTMDVNSGGTANGTTISAGGILNVSHGGVVSGAVALRFPHGAASILPRKDPLKKQDCQRHN